MGSFPSNSREGRHGKLTEVLDHQLRIGDEKVADSIIAAYKERGLTPPEHIESPPQIRADYIAYWEAYRDLISERKTPRGPIPALSIIQYADAYGLPRESLKRIVWAVDKVLTDHWTKLDEAEKLKRDRDRESKQRLGANK